MNPSERRPSPSNTNALVSVFSGGKCVGFILSRGKCAEAFDARELSLGVYDTRCEAAQAVLDTVREP